MGHGDPGVGQSSDGRGDSRNDFEAQACGRQFSRLLAAPTEEEGIAALEADDAFSLAGVLHEQGVGLLLPERVAAGCLSGVDFLGLGRNVAQEFRIAQVIVDHDLGPLEAFPALEGQEPRIARTCANKVTDPFGRNAGGSAGF